MTSEVASLKKISGHITEHDFAELIGGQVNAGNQQAKKDVIDKQHKSHSVKSGTFWQIFLYRRSHWESNTIFRGMGNIADIMIQCLDAFPENRNDYLADKHKYKIALQEPMKKLLQELNNNRFFPAFLSKALFNGGEVDYLTIKRSNGKFHIFAQKDVLKTLEENMKLENSRARTKSQYDSQKVLFKIKNTKGKFVNTGEIEVRNDSKIHYREMKCRFNGNKIFELLEREIGAGEKKASNVLAHGEAIKTFKEI